MQGLINSTNLASVLGVSNSTVTSWVAHGKIHPVKKDNSYFYFDSTVLPFPELKLMKESSWEAEEKIKPIRQFNSIELFAGGGGLALGLHEAGFNQVLFNEFNHDACETLRKNFKASNVIEGDVHDVDFTPYKGKIDFLSGGFPCQAFSYAGNQKGFDDARGTLFFELARAIKETQPKVFLGENVKGLVSHDNGKTFKVISQIIDELGYYLVPPRVLKAVMYKVPQKRERIFLVGIRKDFADKVTFHWPSPYHRVMTLQDAFYKGELYDCDVPESIGQKYPKRKAEILSKVPQGGDWRDLPEDLQKEYMKGSFYLGGGKTGMARRLSLDEPSLTLTCAPAQKQTERCHPLETRPLTVREYARIQTFPDSWKFAGSESSQYKQIGNAVPVNLAKAMGHSLIRLLNDIEQTKGEML
ncbi:DNA (cytosine-5-)-methyltransferase [uncultured Treponema sp.]|uniref:DNA (cytosine-5-)-methyltransferase n=1 Tax=uncultured Treponema sp. TaxID=162155 RepID=UPI0025DF60BA|nr:DNA (cytosine-5-)-methyltransferase [uncultured Treponema sp.]